MRRQVIYILLILFAASAFRCSEKGPTSPSSIPKDTFVKLYIDLLIARETGFFISGESATGGFVDSLYTHYGVTESQVRETMEEYNKDVVRWKEFYDEVTKQLEVVQQEQQSKEQ